MHLSVGDTVLFCDGNVYTIKRIGFQEGKWQYWLSSFKYPLDESTLFTWSIPFKNSAQINGRT